MRAWALLPAHGNQRRPRPGKRASQPIKKLFHQSLKMLLTGIRHRPILPATRDGKNSQSPKQRGKEADSRFALDESNASS
jgi:hypothetical protein